MAAVTHSRPRSFLGRVAGEVRRHRLGAQLAARAVVFAREHLTTVAAWSAVCTGAWEGSVIAGWVVTGVAILALDWHIRG